MNLRSYFYLVEGELPPKDAPDEWFLLPDSTQKRSEEEVEKFLVGCSYLKEYLRDDMPEEDIQFHFYEAAKKAFGDEKSSIREFFKLLYLVIFSKPQGSRWGMYVQMVGVSEFLNDLSVKLFEYGGIEL